MDLPAVIDQLRSLAPALAVVAVTAFAASAFALWVRRTIRRARLAQQARRHTEAIAAATALGRPPPEQPAPLAQLPFGWLIAPAIVTAAVAAALEAMSLLPVAYALRIVRDALRAHLFEVGRVPFTPMTAVTVALVILATRWVSRAAQTGLAAQLRRHGDADEGVIAALQRLTHYGIIALGLAIGLQTAGINLSTLLAASAVFAVGIGLGLQSMAQNFISGLILLVERSIKPGDMLTVDGEVVRVREMGIRATVARSLDDEDLVIPNGKLVENTVINHSLQTNVVRARMVVGVAYDSDLDAVMRVLNDAAEACPARVRSKPPVVMLIGFGSSSIDFEVSIWVSDAFARPRSLSRLRMDVWRALRDARLVIAFPQLDVHLDPPVVDALRRTRLPADPPT